MPDRDLREVIQRIQALDGVPVELSLQLDSIVSDQLFAAPEMDWHAWAVAGDFLNAYGQEMPAAREAAAIFNGTATDQPTAEAPSG